LEFRFQNHSGPGAKPQTVLQHGKAKQAQGTIENALPSPMDSMLKVARATGASGRIWLKRIDSTKTQ
jgi:hypothetical protein